MSYAEGDPRIAAKSILVVEDETLVRMDVAMSLENEGYHVIQAANAEEALTVLQTQTPVHLVLTDINMPGLLMGCNLRPRFACSCPT